MRRAFTLTEVLIVVAILVILGALVFPAVASVRKDALGVVCISNLSQLGQATAMYAADYDDGMPFAPSPLTKFEERSGPVLGEPYDTYARELPDVRTPLASYGPTQPTWICPVDRIDEVLADEGGHADTFYQECGSSYQYDDVHALRGQWFTDYPSPSQNIVFSDISGFHGGAGLHAVFTVLFADLHCKCILNGERVALLDAYPP